MIESAFIELSLVLIVTVALAGLMRVLKQPLIVAYILAGILLGPVFGMVRSTPAFSTLGELGVALLLFMVGLGLNPGVIREVGWVSVLAGIGQILSTFVIAAGISLALGFSPLTAAYIAIALTFSSTIIIVKLLSDRGDTQALYGKISIGVLIVQDLVAILLLMLISSLSSSSELTATVAISVLRGEAALALLVMFSIYLLPGLTRLIAKSQEYLLLFSLAWCLALGALFSYLKFSVEIGALLAGVTLSMSPFRHEINARMKPLRDFFVVLFFVLIGSQISFSDLGQHFLAIALFTAFILFASPFIVMALMGLLGYSKRTGFLSGITLAQISEFSFILIALGVKVGHLSPDILSLVTFVGVVTIAGSSYFISYGDRIYQFLSPYLALFEKKGSRVDEYASHQQKSYDIILFGYNRIGYDLLAAFRRMRKSVLVVDYDPEVIRTLAKEGVPCRYGDADDAEFLGELPLAKAKMVASTIPGHDTSLLILGMTKRAGSQAITLVVSHDIESSMRLYDRGASYVIIPHLLGGYHTAAMLDEYGLDRELFDRERAAHIDSLRERKKRGHARPSGELTYY